MLPNIDVSKLEILKEKGVFTIALIPPRLISVFWDMLLVQLEKDPSLWDRGQTLESLRDYLEANELQLWVVVKESKVCLFCMTMFYQFAKVKSLQVVWAMGGQLEQHLALLLSALETYALAHGCLVVEIIGREGWAKPLRPFNYVKLQTTFAKELSAERIH